MKNEVAKRIIQKYDGFVLLSMGELLRKSVGDQPDDELWKRVNGKIDEGEPVPTVGFSVWSIEDPPLEALSSASLLGNPSRRPGCLGICY